MRVTGPLRFRIRRLCVRALSLQSKLGSLERYYSPTELVVFAESPWASWMDRLTREQPQHALAASADAPSAFLQMLAAKGVLQEAGVLRDAFAARGLRIADLSSARGTEVEVVQRGLPTDRDPPFFELHFCHDVAEGQSCFTLGVE